MQIEVSKGLHIARTKGRGRRRVISRAALFGAWLVFWLNALLYPCMDAAAALSRNDCGGAAGVVARVPAANHVQPLHAADSGTDLDPLCCHVLSSAPGTVDVGPGVALDHQPGAGSPIDVTGHAQLLTSTRLESLAYQEIPPPRVPLYLRTSRLRN
jgi:hypothetical protein